MRPPPWRTNSVIVREFAAAEAESRATITAKCAVSSGLTAPCAAAMLGATAKRALACQPRSSSAARTNFPSHPASPSTSTRRGASESRSAARASCALSRAENSGTSAGRVSVVAGDAPVIESRRPARSDTVIVSPRRAAMNARTPPAGSARGDSSIASGASGAAARHVTRLPERARARSHSRESGVGAARNDTSSHAGSAERESRGNSAGSASPGIATRRARRRAERDRQCPREQRERQRAPAALDPAPRLSW